MNEKKLNDISKFFRGIQSYLSFVNATYCYICKTQDNNTLVLDICCKKSGKTISYLNSGLDYQIDEFLNMNFFNAFFKESYSINIYKDMPYEDFLKMTSVWEVEHEFELIEN